MVHKFFDEKTASLADKSAGDGAIKNKIISNKQLAEQLHKPIIRKFEKVEVHSSFIDNVWGADLAGMRLISKFNKAFRFLLCVIDIYSKYVWVNPLKDKKGTKITNSVQVTYQKKYGEIKAVNFIIDQ